MTDFIYQCALEGVADYIYNLSNRAPEWMDGSEKKSWRIGFNYAKNICRK